MSNEPMPIYLPSKPRNRRERRTYLHEVERNIGLFDEIEVEFLEDLFHEDEIAGFEDNYDELYMAYLERHSKLVNWMAENGKFRYTTPNKRWFMQKYRPIETPYEIDIYLTLSNLFAHV